MNRSISSSSRDVLGVSCYYVGNMANVGVNLRLWGIALVNRPLPDVIGDSKARGVPGGSRTG
jgi:hypothetical protein